MPSVTALDDFAGELLALAAGLLMPLAFAPFGWYPVAFLAPALLLLVCLRVSPRRAFLRGWLFGQGQFGAGVYWIYLSLHDFGNAAPIFAALATALLVIYLALYPALVCYFSSRWGRHDTAVGALLLFPALWTLSEWLRERLLSGFPWLSTGYSQSDSALAGWLPVVGVLGVGLFTVLVAGALLVIVSGDTRRRLLGLVTLASVFAGGLLLARVDWVRPDGGPVSVALVQGNIPQALKWQPRWQRETLNRYRDLTLSTPPVDVVVWPETALPGLLDEMQVFTDAMVVELDKRGTELVAGVPTRDSERRFFNSLVRFGAVNEVYSKRHLVPFGEYLPLRSWLEFFEDYVQIPMADFSPGSTAHGTLEVAGVLFGVSICYEIIFGEQIRRSLPAAGLLLNVSNDAWFGDSLAPHQHLQMARVRAREAARPLLRATNDGITAAIDHQGRVLSRLSRDEPGVLVALAQPMAGSTPYARLGQWPVLAGALMMLLAAILLYSRHSRFRPPADTA